MTALLFGVVATAAVAGLGAFAVEVGRYFERAWQDEEEQRWTGP